MESLWLKYAIAIVIALNLALSLTAVADGHWQPGPHNVKHAVVGEFCATNDLTRPCGLGLQALRIVSCETGGTFSPWASNGQYLGIFQMGSSERRKFGHGIDPWTQAKAAHRYQRLSGWWPWECAFLTGIL